MDPSGGGPVEGVVAVWDEARGVGTVRTDAGRELVLQCTNLADGSRTTQVGTRVRARVQAGHHGRWQAVAVERITDDAAPPCAEG